MKRKKKKKKVRGTSKFNVQLFLCIGVDQKSKVEAHLIDKPLSYFFFKYRAVCVCFFYEAHICKKKNK